MLTRIQWFVRGGLVLNSLMRGGRERLRLGVNRELVRGQTNSYGGQNPAIAGIRGLAQGTYNTPPPDDSCSFARGAK